MSELIDCFNGYRLIETRAITKEIQRKKHKKRRINKKWLKRYGHKSVLDNEKIVIFENNILATPKTIKKIIEQTKAKVRAE